MPDLEVPSNIALALENSQKIINEAFEEAKAGSKKFSKELNNRRYLAYSLKFISLLSAVFITAGLLPQYLAIVIAILYGIDSILSNSKRLIAIAYAKKAYENSEKKLIRTHQIEQAEIFKEADKIKLMEQQTELNIRLTKVAHTDFKTVEDAVDKSDIETLQTLSLDEEKLNELTKYIQSKKQ